MSGFEPLPPGELVRLAYRLGLKRATGVLTVMRGARRDVLVLRRGHLMTSSAGDLGRQASRRLEQLAAAAHASARFEGGVAAYPPGAVQREFALAVWARGHLERQVDAGRARELARALAGVRLSVRASLSPDPTACDATDLRILSAMRLPRRLDQIWPMARTPRFRLMAFLHFLRGVGALREDGVAARAVPPTTLAGDARRILGVAADADRQSVKRAYRRLARALHPDLQPGLSAARRRALERKLADVTHAYRALSS